MYNVVQQEFEEAIVQLPISRPSESAKGCAQIDLGTMYVQCIVFSNNVLCPVIM